MKSVCILLRLKVWGVAAWININQMLLAIGLISTSELDFVDMNWIG